MTLLLHSSLENLFVKVVVPGTLSIIHIKLIFFWNLDFYLFVRTWTKILLTRGHFLNYFHTAPTLFWQP